MCNHDKKYSDTSVLMSFPAKIPWKCNKCGAIGHDVEKRTINISKIEEEFGLTEKQ